MRKQVWTTLALVAAIALSRTAEAAVEVCGNDLDDDGDGLADNNCASTQSTGVCENPLGCGTTGMVSWSTGALSYALPPDISFRSSFGPQVLNFSRFYTSQYAPGSTPTTVKHKPLGERWQHSFMTFLSKSGTTLIVHTAEGRDVLFTKTGTDASYDLYTAQLGYHVLHLRQSKAVPQNFDLRTLTGETLVYNPSGQLIEVWDNLVTPNKAYVTWNSTSGGSVSTVTDAGGADRLKFTYSVGPLSSVELQHYNGSSWSTTHTTTFSYTSGVLTSTTIGSQLAQQYSYDGNGYLTQIADGAGDRIAGFAYSSTSSGQVDRIDTSRGTVGFDFNSSRSSCSGKTVLYFNKANTTSCSLDSDCGTGAICGGKTGSGSTGTCFRAARCITLTTSSSGSEKLIDTVTPIGGGSGGSCSGACTDVAQYIWGTSSNALDVLGIKDPLGNYVSKAYNSNGLPTKIVYADTDSNPATVPSGARVVYMFYDTVLPGRLTEIRRKSDLSSSASSCSDSNTTGCARTVLTYNTSAGNELSTITQSGSTYDSAGAVVAYSYTTNYTYNRSGPVGAISEVTGPVTNAKTQFVYAGSAPFRLTGVKRYSGASNFLQRSFAAYDSFGNATAITEVDGSMTCLTFDSSRNVLTQSRHAMAGQTSCSTTNGADITTNWARDSALRLTQLQRPDGSCIHYAYDSVGRLSTTKRRDDCTPGSAGDREDYVYSADGLLTEIDTYDASSTITRKQLWTHFASRRIQQIVNPVDTSKFTGLVYDDRGLLTEVNGAGNLNKTTFGIDADGRVTTVNKYVTSSTYDSWTLSYAFDGDQKGYTDGDSKTTDSVRDDLGRVVRLQTPDMDSTSGGGPYATLQLYDAAGNVTTVIEAKGGVGEKTRTFTYDALGRQLTVDFDGVCQSGSPPEIQRTFDALPSGVSCPSGLTCANLAGRLAYVKVSLMCDGSSDHSLDQWTFFNYDAAGRLVGEYVRDDSGRVADHLYEWSKSGVLTKTTLPSGAVIGATLGSTGSNADTDKITALWRTNTSTPIIDSIVWYPYGGLKQYHQQNTQSSLTIDTKITRDLAYRVTKTKVERSSGDALHQVDTLRDAAGRVIKRDYYPSDPQIAGLYDSYVLYDYQNHVLCETTGLVTSCPTSGSNIKNSHTASPPFTHAGDWKTLLRPIAGSTGLTHSFAITTGRHQISAVTQSDGTPTLGRTAYTYDDRGNRDSDDQDTSLTHDARTFTYDSRGNVVNVRGEFYIGGAWHYYDVASAFDSKNRRVYKSFYDESTAKLTTWFFYYDALDRIAEVRHTPDTSSSSTYSVFQLFWLEDRLVLYWQTDYPSATTSKRYVGTDETGRPVDMYSWPSSGSAVRVWSVNPDAWGNDKVLVGPTIYQPILFAGQYKDDETVALWDDHVTVHRPGVVLNGFRTYDPFVGGYLQVDPLVDATRSSYVYVDSSPVGAIDPDGRAKKGIGGLKGCSFPKLGHFAFNEPTADGKTPIHLGGFFPSFNIKNWRPDSVIPFFDTPALGIGGVEVCGTDIPTGPGTKPPFEGMFPGDRTDPPRGCTPPVEPYACALCLQSCAQAKSISLVCLVQPCPEADVAALNECKEQQCGSAGDGSCTVVCGFSPSGGGGIQVGGGTLAVGQ
ncbi:MAG: hypothetical protein KIT31_11790 [Deltaproteobacteria bacterium]|nr:hypothetical protein [Deltaproteobacteria bacterium]